MGDGCVRGLGERGTALHVVFFCTRFLACVCVVCVCVNL